MENFNKLTRAEIERLAYLSEECGEVIQIVGKILRHGYDSYNPLDPKKLDNRALLNMELSDILKAMTRMLDSGDIDLNIGKKLYTNSEYWHHQEK